jgi:ABC-type multidrug transport system fused ATPase/permease subunit
LDFRNFNDACVPAVAAARQTTEPARVCAQPDDAMTAQLDKHPAAIRVVLPFMFRHWLHQPMLAAAVVAGLLGATMADLFMPVFSGRLVDAMTSGASDPAARRAALTAFIAIVSLGLVSMILRLAGLQAIVPFTLRIMSDVSRDAFMRVQRFSTDWHANSFAGSTVRKITRGMWALDLLNDTILMALLPSLAVLLGSMILIGLHWPSLGLVVDGRIELDNNTVERSIRPIALNRKNALFAGSDGGAEHWATIASLIETCKLNDVDPLAYLTDVLTRIVNGHPNSDIDQLLPWAYRQPDLKAVA